MNRKAVAHLKNRLFVLVMVLSLLALDTGVMGLLAVQAQAGTKSNQDICLVEGTVKIPAPEMEALKSALSDALEEVAFNHAECFAIIDLRDEGEWLILTVIGLVDVKGNRAWTVSSNGRWSDLAVIHHSNSSISAAIAGTVHFSELLAKIPEGIFSQNIKNVLDPLVSDKLKPGSNGGLNAMNSYIFPFDGGTQVKFFRFHWDTADNYTFWTGANSKAVDLGSDGNTTLNHSPNRLLAVAPGTVKHRCSEEGSYSSTYLAVQNDDGAKIIYAHLNKASAPNVGDRITQGQYLGVLKIGDFQDGKCGHADQGLSEFHIHFEVPNTTSLTLSDWTLNTSTGIWTRGNETWSAGEYKQIGMSYGSFLLNDEFGDSTLDPYWHWYREDSTHWSLTALPGYLRIITQPKDIWRSSNNAPLLLQSLQKSWGEDFDIQTRIVIKPLADFHQGGLVVYGDDDNYVRFTYAYIAGPMFEFAKETAGNFQPIQVAAPQGIDDFHLRIAKVGTNYFAYYSRNGINWTFIGAHQNVNISPVQVGLLAFNAEDVTSIEIPADFDYFRVSTGQEYSFGDVPPAYWAWNFIERLYAAGVTGGCTTTPLQYCPQNQVTRAQMAVFLLRAKHGSTYVPPTATGVFEDVPTSDWTAPWIEQLANEGITGGCSETPKRYCPTATITRAQMAVFLLRAEHGASYTPPSATGVFADVPADSWIAPWIEQLANEGITGGCGGGNYCPGNPVTRDQMAVFLVRAFDLP